MSIRPIDMQIATVRALDHPEAKMNVLHRADLAHDNSNAAMEKAEIKKRNSVNELEKGSSSRSIKENDKDRGGRQGYGQNKNKDDEAEKSKSGEVPHLDIII